MITTAQKRDCAEREAKIRKRVYPRWVTEERMSAEKAATEIAIMEAIAADYAKQAEDERLI